MANASNLIKEPHPNTLSKGPVQGGAYNIAGTSIWLNLVANGTPTGAQGAGWADKGSSLVDSTTGKWYSNRGTAAAPNWVEFNNA